MKQEEIARVKAEFSADEERLKKRQAEELKAIEERFNKEIDTERQYLENLIEMEIVKLKEEYDVKIDEINRSRYKNIGTDGGPGGASGAIGEMDTLAVEKLRQQLEEEIVKEREEFNRASRERRLRFDQQMRMWVQGPDEKRVAFLKKHIVPLVQATGMVRIADDSILETRHQLKITRHAVRTGQSWALYRGTYQNTKIICRVGVMVKTPLEIRAGLDHAAKCTRFACEKPAIDRFVKVYNIFATDQKIYVLMDEVNPASWQFMAYRNTGEAKNNLKKWLKQLIDALAWLHLYSIAHLNIRLENIIFTEETKDLKLVGFSRAFCSFNLDQERFIMAKKCNMAPHNDHFPPECFENDFDPQLADMWSLGALIYEAETKTNPRKKLIKERSIRNTPGTPKTIKTPQQRNNNNEQFEQEFKRPQFPLMNKISDDNLRSLTNNLLDFVPYSRGRMEDLKEASYFKSGE